MPLHPGTSPAVFSRNVSDMIRAGHPRAQALAASYREQRQHRAPGGPVLPPMAGPGALPSPQAGLGQISSPQAAPGLPMGIPPMPPGSAPNAPPGMMGGLGALGAPPMGGKPLGMAAGGSPIASTPFFARQESRGVAKTGPVIGSGLGRGDAKAISVPGGSHVIPADVVSGIGQGNSGAGHSILSRMFSGGPYGTSAPKMGHGMGPPRPPRASGFGPMAHGGAAGNGIPVKIQISDGEFTVPPHIVNAIGGGNQDRGHAILDAFIKHERKKHISVLRKLPPPATK